MKELILVYPNPVNTTLHFQIVESNLKEYKISLYNSLGIKTAQFSIEPGSANIDVSKFPSGIYFAKISSVGNSDINLKLMIQH
ncbi:MAG TPA: T9SS type A sorting domain-containing protein [Saprospiraceae bacterium]|nr:T9SS type A sorting domain-containing protein [Saprospiraceae bacterium]